jgi:hypothetical protein
VSGGISPCLQSYNGKLRPRLLFRALVVLFASSKT